MMRNNLKLILVIYSLFLLSCVSSVPRYTNKVYNREQGSGDDFVHKNSLLPEIKKFYGAPYKWAGDSPRGTDCSGMVKTIYHNAYGIDLPHNAHQIYKNGIKISKNNLEFGDLVFFSKNGFRASHMGIYIKNGFFVHASSSRGVTLDHLSERPYSYQFMGCVRVPIH